MLIETMEMREHRAPGGKMPTEIVAGCYKFWGQWGAWKEEEPHWHGLAK